MQKSGIPKMRHYAGFLQIGSHLHMQLASYIYIYGTAHIQVYKQTHVTCRASRNFEDNSHVGLVQHEEYTCSRVIIDELKMLASNSCCVVLHSGVITYVSGKYS